MKDRGWRSDAADRFFVLRRELYRFALWATGRGCKDALSDFDILDSHEVQLSAIVDRAVKDIEVVARRYEVECGALLEGAPSLDYQERASLEALNRRIKKLLALLDNLSLSAINDKGGS